MCPRSSSEDLKSIPTWTCCNSMQHLQTDDLEPHYPATRHHSLSLGFNGMRVPRCEISGNVYQQRRQPTPVAFFFPKIPPLHFLSVGLLSRALFTNHVSRIYDPKKHITDAIMTIQANMLLRTRQELEYRMEVHATNGVTLRCTEAS